jgi:Mn-dependent DtxR family transcriptional regulator
LQSGNLGINEIASGFRRIENLLRWQSVTLLHPTRRGPLPTCELPKIVVLSACDMTRRPPSQSAEDYLERILELIQEKGFARVADIAMSLRVRQASVTDMVQKLARQGYLKYERYQDVVMTNKGRDVARRIQDRHKTLSRFFSLLGLDVATQREDIEGIEHHLSQTTVSVLSDLAQYFEKHPQTLKSFLQSRNGGRNPKRKT